MAIDELLILGEEKMEKAVGALKKEFASPVHGVFVEILQFDSLLPRHRHNLMILPLFHQQGVYCDAASERLHNGVFAFNVHLFNPSLIFLTSSCLPHDLAPSVHLPA